MPVHDIEKVNANRLMAIYHITETYNDLLLQLNPNTKDRDLLLTFTHDQKKLEWVAGRLTLKYLTEEFGLEYHGIQKDAFGKPSLRGHKVEISLSHSYPYVAAILDSTMDVGIDLEQPKDKLIKIGPRFLNTTELKDAGNDLRKLCILWCAKEALYKIYSAKGLIFKENLFIHPFERKQSGFLDALISINDKQWRYLIKYEDRGDFLIAFNQ
jgi:4'-phosphopantetheinyl transferase